MYTWWSVNDNGYAIGNYDYGYTLVLVSVRELKEELSENELFDLLDDITALIHKKLDERI